MEYVSRRLFAMRHTCSRYGLVPFGCSHVGSPHRLSKTADCRLCDTSLQIVVQGTDHVGYLSQVYRRSGVHPGKQAVGGRWPAALFHLAWHDYSPAHYVRYLSCMIGDFRQIGHALVAV